MNCVTARCGAQVQPTKMTLACQRVLSSSEVRASDLEHGGSWVRIPSGAQIFFCVLLWLILYISLYFPLYINIGGIRLRKIVKLYDYDEQRELLVHPSSIIEVTSLLRILLLIQLITLWSTNRDRNQKLSEVNVKQLQSKTGREKKNSSTCVYVLHKTSH